MKTLLLQEEVIRDTRLPERHSDIHFYRFISIADTPVNPLFRMCSDASKSVKKMKPPMREIDYSVFKDIQDSCTEVFPEIKHLV